MLASYRDKPKVKGRTKLSDQQIHKLIDNTLTDVFDADGGIYHI